MAGTIEGYDYRKHQPIRMACREARQLIAQARAAGLLRRAAGDTLLMHRNAHKDLRIAMEFYTTQTQQDLPLEE